MSILKPASCQPHQRHVGISLTKSTLSFLSFLLSFISIPYHLNSSFQLAGLYVLEIWWEDEGLIVSMGVRRLLIPLVDTHAG